MKKWSAILLWPYVFFLDWLISLTGSQSFKESRRITRMHFNRIMNGESVDNISNEKEPKPSKPLNITKNPYFSKNSSQGQ